jgi:N-acetylglucosamine-6-phosphate deacetylase
MIVLAGGDLVLRDRIMTGSLVIAGARIAAVEARTHVDTPGATRIDVSGHVVVPGFIDVHVHGVDGHDTLDPEGAVTAMAARLPKYGVTAFCPTTVACAPPQLRRVLEHVRALRIAPPAASARVLPAHLESNFINPDYRGAQPLDCLRAPAARVAEGTFTGAEILDLIAAFRPDVGIVTLAPEIEGGLDLVRQLVTAGHRVSLGHSGANFEDAIAAIEAGASQATHLFNRMTPMTHRAPGLAGAILEREGAAAELICDGHHVHPAMCRTVIRAKGTAGVMAITDGTAGTGLRPGSTARLGGREITVEPHAAVLGDGTPAGGTLAMDGVFRTIVSTFDMSLVDAAALCATTPARQLGLTGLGTLAEGAIADLVVLDGSLKVARTFIGGREVYRSGAVA